MADRVIMITIGADGKAAVKEIEEVNKSVTGLGDQSKKTKEPLDGLNLSSLASGTALKVLGSAAAAVSLGVLIKEASTLAIEYTMLAARAEMLSVIMPVVGNNAGYTAEQMNAYAEGVKKMGITTEESRQTVIRMASAHMDLSKSAELARIAQDAGRIANINSSEALQRMIYGIISQQPEMLRTMELNVDFEKSYRKLADTLHISWQELTQNQKIQAATNAVIEKGKDINGTYAATMGTTGGQVLSLNRLHTELKKTVGDVFLPASTVAVDTYTSALKWMFEKIDQNRPALKELAQDLANIATAIRHPIDSLTNVILDPWMKDEEETQRQAAVEKEWQQTKKTIEKRQEAQKIAAADAARKMKEQEEANLASRDRRRAALDAALAVELATIKSGIEKQTQAYKTQEKDLDLVFAQRAISEMDFYTQKTTLEKAAIQSTIDGLAKERAAIIKESAAKAGLFKEDKERIKEQGEAKAKVAAIDAEIDKQKQEAARKGIDLRIKEVEQERQVSLARAKIAEQDFLNQVQWLDKLDQYKLKTGKIDDVDALNAKFSREQQTLAVKQQTLAVEIFQEQSLAKRNELEAQYWRIDEQIKQSKQDQLNETDLLIRKTEQLTFAHQQNMAAIAATAQVSALQFAGQDQAALTAQYAAQNAAAQAQYDEQMRLAGVNHDLQLQAENAFQERKFQLQTEYSQKQAELWWNGAQTYISFAQQMTTMGLQLLMADEKNKDQIGKRMLATSIRFIAQTVQQYMFGEAKKHLIAAFSSAGQITVQQAQHTASLAMLETEAIAWAAFLNALALNPYGGQVVIPSAIAMDAVAGGVIPAAIAATTAEGSMGIATELGMAAAWAVGGILVGALGEAAASSIEGSGSTSGTTGGGGGGGNGGGGGGISAPIAADNRATAPTYNFHIYGNVYDHDQLARELVPALNKAVADGVS